MKKIIAVFLAALVVFSTASVAIAADEPAGDVATTVTTIKEENTTRNIKNKDGLVVPFNFEQLKMSVVFKIFEKIFKFVLNLFGGGNSGDIDQEGATAVEDAGKWLDEIFSEIESNLNKNNN